MKRVMFFLCIFFYSSLAIYSQVTRTFSSKEDSYASWVTRTGITPYGWLQDHLVGSFNDDNKTWETRSFNTWEWTYSEIPTEAEVTSVRIKFKAVKNGNSSFHIGFHNINYKLNTQGINFFNECVNANKIYDQTFQQGQYLTILFDQEFTSNSPSGAGREIWEAISGAVHSGNYFFTLGIREVGTLLIPRWQISSYDGSGSSVNPAIDLIITYTITDPTVTIDQKLSTGTSVGTLKKWEGSAFGLPFNSGSSFSFIVGSTQTIQATQNLYSNQKYNNWNGYSNINNHKSFIIRPSLNLLAANLAPTYSGIIIRNYIEGSVAGGGNIEFKDPWLNDYADPSFANTLRNRDSLAVFYSRQSPFNPDYSTSYGSNVYKGVFLDEIDPVKSRYSVRTLLNQDIYLNQTNKTHKCYFQNWSGTDVQFVSNETNPSGYDQKDVIFKSSTAIANANLKGTQLSNTASAFTNSSQRKLVRTKDNWLHQVYESMGHVWIEHSSNNGSTWILGNDGKPLDNGGGKCPSIDWNYNRNYPNNSAYYSLVTVFQEPYGSTYKIQYAVFKYTSGSYVRQVPSSTLPLYTEPTGGEQYTSVNANPNISWGDGNRFALTFERKSTVGSMQPGIYWIFGTMFDSGLEPLPAYPCSPVKITGTTASSTNATVSLNKSSNDISSIEVAYQAGTSAPANITRVSLYCDFVGNAWNPSQVSSSVISYQTGYLNTKPSLIQMPNGTVRVCWIRNYYGSSNDPVNTNVVYWNSTTPSVYNYSGNGVNSVSLNIKDDNTNTYFAYAQNTNNTTWQNFASNNTSTVTLNTTGRDIQLSNGSSSSNMYASSYYSSSLPYYFLTSNSLGSLSKSAGEEFTYGRGVILGKDDMGFSYSIKSLTVDNTPVKFAEIPENEVQAGDTLILTRGVEPLGIDSLNTLLISEPFKIQKGTTVSFSEGGGFIRNEGSADTSKVQQAGDYINCLVELVEEGTNKSLGVIKQNQFISGDKKESGLSFSNVKMNNSEEKPVRLKITLTTNITGVQGMFVNEYNTVNDELLQKLAAQDITLQEEGVIKNYALEQNYPNPFNPSTTISYQLPKDGMVTLKIYDAIGREVKTLVDEFKQKGKYSINFNGSELASGVYFYRINVNGFSVSKKLMLLK